MPPIEFTVPHPIDDCLATLQAAEGEVASWWQSQIILRPKAGFTRIGVRHVPQFGIRYHLALMRIDLTPQDDETTYVSAQQSVNIWVWFAMVPMALLLVYSLLLFIVGELAIVPESVGMTLLITGYLIYLSLLLRDHWQRNTAIVQRLGSQTKTGVVETYPALNSF